MKETGIPLHQEDPVLRVYRAMASLYPGVFRERYSGEMIEIFAETWGRVCRESPASRWRYGLEVLRDWARTMTLEWWRCMPLLTKAAAIGICANIGLFIFERQFLALTYGLLIVGYFLSFVLFRWINAAVLALAAPCWGIAGVAIVRWLASFGPGHDLGRFHDVVLFIVILLVGLDLLTGKYTIGPINPSIQHRPKTGQRMRVVGEILFFGCFIAVFVAVKRWGGIAGDAGCQFWMYCLFFSTNLGRLWRAGARLDQPDMAVPEKR